MPQSSIPPRKGASHLTAARRLVVKTGSALVVDTENGEIRSSWISTLIEDVVRFHARGQEVLIVSSGAIAIGTQHCNRFRGSLRIEEKQAAAAIGQLRLMLAYEQHFNEHRLAVGQILLTSDDIDVPKRHTNAKATLEELLKLGIVPIINENDTTATAEIRFGDNDRLAAKVAQMVDADVLVLLSDVDGLYTADPRINPSAVFVPEVKAITPEIKAMAGHAPAGFSSGGMVTKLMAAEVAMAAKCRMVIAAGNVRYPLAQIEEGGRATWFVPTWQEDQSQAAELASAPSPLATGY